MIQNGETFTRTYNGADEYNFTVYYYDEAGNLQRTVPPAGVDVGIVNTFVPLAISSTALPLYSSATGVTNNYVNDSRYNNYNALIKERTVDGGETNFIYDRTGRIVASQNAKQLAMTTTGNNYYTYTLYDTRGRVIQTGEVKLALPLVTANLSYTTFSGLIAAAANTSKKQVTRIYYDEPTASSSILSHFIGSLQQNVRNNVAYSTYIEDYLPLATDYDHATYYSYDDHGNVAELAHHSKQLDVFGAGAFKNIQYEYELLSGNMIKCFYQKGFNDQFIHHYVYDNDNRLHEVFTSKDDLNWDRDAKYFYYEHGTLARIERADKKVQGSDHFYTIHGWIKAINSNGLTKTADAGKDAASGTNYNAITIFING